MILDVGYDTTRVFLKLAPDGAVEWMRSIDTAPIPSNVGENCLVATPDGGACILFRVNFIPGSGVQNALLVRLNSDGSTLWSKMITVPTITSYGLSVRLAISSSGEPFVFAYGSRSVVTKLDANGDLLWCRRVWDSDPLSSFENSNTLIPTSDGGCAFLGGSFSSQPDSSIVVGRLDAQGDVIWINAYSNPQQGVEVNRSSITVDEDDNITLMSPAPWSTNTYTSLSLRLDPSGVVKHALLYDASGPDHLWDPKVHAVNSDQVYITGKVGWGTCVILTDSMGGVMNAFRTMDDTSGTQFRHMYNWLFDSRDGQLQLTGEFYEQNVVNPTYFTLVSIWRSDNGFTDACFLEPMTVSVSSLPPGSISVSSVGQMVPESTTVQPATVTNNALPVPVLSSFCAILSVHESSSVDSVSLRPNPVSQELIVERSELSPGDRWMIMSMTGEMVASGLAAGPSLQIPVQYLAPGAYLLRLMSERGVFAERFIKY